MTYNRGLVARASRWWGLLTNPLLQSTETHMFSAGTNTSHHTSIPFFCGGIEVEIYYISVNINFIKSN